MTPKQRLQAKVKMLFNTNIAQYALQYVGIKEVEGSKSNPVILKWIKDEFPNAIDDSKTAWCSLFLMQIFKECRLDYNGVNATAKSWANLANSEEVGLFDININDIAIFHRTTPDSWKGHVGIVLDLNIDGDIVLLSGNHRNKVTVEAWKTDKLWKIIRPFNQFV